NEELPDPQVVGPGVSDVLRNRIGSGGRSRLTPWTADVDAFRRGEVPGARCHCAFARAVPRHLRGQSKGCGARFGGTGNAISPPREPGGLIVKPAFASLNCSGDRI